MMRRLHTHAAWCCVLVLAATVSSQLVDEIIPVDITSILTADNNSTSTKTTNGTSNLAPSPSPSPPFKPQVKTDSPPVSQSPSPEPQLTVAQATVWNRPPPPPPSPPPAMKQCTWDGYSCQYFINYAWSVVRPQNLTLAGLGNQKDLDDMAGFYMWGCVVHKDRATCAGDKYHKCVWEKSTGKCWVDVGFTQSYFAKNYMCTDNDITLFTRCALVPTAQACTATWGCRVMPDAKRRSMRRLQGESQVPACVPWWFLNYTPEQQNQYLVDVDDADSQIWKACPNARFPYSYKASCDLDTPDACNAVSHCTWRDSALKCSIQDQGVLAFLYKSPENARNLVSQARTCAAITNWKKCDQLTSSPMKVVPTVVNRPPRPPPPPPKGAATVSRAAGLNGAANIGSANGTSSMKAANMSVMQTMPTDAMKGTMQQSAVKTNGAQQQAAGLQLLAAAALAVLLAL